MLEFVDAPDPEDTLFEDHGVKLFIDPKSLVYLDGTIVDYAKEGLNEGLEFRNPNVAGNAVVVKLHGRAWLWSLRTRGFVPGLF